MFDESARGVYIISVTPFDERGALDLEGTDRLIDFYIDFMLERLERAPAPRSVRAAS